jgi:hypothetical protein
MWIYRLPINIMDGWYSLATANNAFTSFSPSPTYLEVNEDEVMLKNVDFDS